MSCAAGAVLSAWTSGITHLQATARPEWLGENPLNFRVVAIGQQHSARLYELSIVVPSCAGPSRYDVAELMECCERGEIQWWNVEPSTTLGRR